MIKPNDDKPLKFIVKCADGHETIYRPKGGDIPKRIRCAKRVDGQACKKPCEIIKALKDDDPVTPPDREKKIETPLKAKKVENVKTEKEVITLDHHLDKITNPGVSLLIQSLIEKAKANKLKINITKYNISMKEPNRRRYDLRIEPVKTSIRLYFNINVETFGAEFNVLVDANEIQDISTTEKRGEKYHWKMKNCTEKDMDVAKQIVANLVHISG